MLIKGIMNRIFLLVAAFLTVSCASSGGHSVPDLKQKLHARAPIPADLRQQVARASGIGRQLYFLDKAAAIGTDVLLERVPDPEKRGLAGYLSLFDSDTPSGTFLVSFFTKEEVPRIAYEIRVIPERKPEFTAFDPPKVTTPTYAALVTARQKALAAMPRHGQPINPILVPGEANGEHGVLVYLLASTKKPNVAVFGKHHRALVPLDGPGITYMMPLSQSAFELPTRAPGQGKTVGLFIKHFVTDYPLETHVFTGLLHKIPLYVVTRRGVWFVDRGEIFFVSADVPPEF
jgi:hypothetical protein